MSSEDEASLTLPDGRVVEYFDRGDPSGRPMSISRSLTSGSQEFRVVIADAPSKEQELLKRLTDWHREGRRPARVGR